MGRDDKGRYPVIHHLGAASAGTAKPAGPYAQKRAGGQDPAPLPEAGAPVTDAAADPGGIIASAAGAPGSGFSPG